MIQKGTVLKVLDNTGAKFVRCIALYKCGREAGIGQLIRVSIISATPNGKVKKGTVYKAVIVGTVSKCVRENGSSISFSENSAVLLNDKMGAVGTRINGIVPKEVDAKLRALAWGVC